MTKKIVPLLVMLSFLITGFSASEYDPQITPLTPGGVEQQLEPGFTYESGIVDYKAPSAAYSTASDQYLLVFEDGEGNLKLDYWHAASGNPAGGYHEIQSDDGAHNPDVIYDRRNNRFLVVWDELVCLGVPSVCHYVIKGQLLFGGYRKEGIFAGSVFTIASRHGSGIDMRQPAAAYNDIDYQYVVVFRYGQDYIDSYPSIHGQMISASEGEPQVLNEDGSDLGGFEIRKYDSGWEVRNPDVAWNSNGGTFMAVWQTSHDSQDDHISGRHLYDYYRSGFSQGYGDNAFMLAPFNGGPNPLSHECSHPSIAYDPVNKNYIMVFQHKEGDEVVSPSTIHAQGINRDFDVTKILTGYAFPVETDNSKVEYHMRPVIDYSGLGEDMYMAYVSWDLNDPGIDQFWLTERTLRGKDVGPRLKIRTGEPDESIDHPNVAGTDSGRALVTWEETGGSIEGRDIHGARIKPLDFITLPILIKE